MALKLLLADDHDLVRQAIRCLLERNGFTIAGEAADGLEAVRLAQRHAPDVALLDCAMPLMNGLEAAREIRQTAPRTRVLMLTVHQEPRYVLDALRAGVTGYLLKTRAAEQLVQAIHEVAAGHFYLGPVVSRQVVQLLIGDDEIPPTPLSLRERHMLQLVAEGHTASEIAASLDISTRSAELLRYRLMDKLDIHETAGLVRYAVRECIVEP